MNGKIEGKCKYYLPLDQNIPHGSSQDELKMCVYKSPNMEYGFFGSVVIMLLFIVFFKPCANKDYIKVPTINDRCKMQQ